MTSKNASKKPEKENTKPTEIEKKWLKDFVDSQKLEK